MIKEFQVWVVENREMVAKTVIVRTGSHLSLPEVQEVRESSGNSKIVSFFDRISQGFGMTKYLAVNRQTYFQALVQTYLSLGFGDGQARQMALSATLEKYGPV